MRMLSGIFLAMVYCATAQPAASAAEEAQPLTWIFLNTGAGRSKVKWMEQEVVAKMQADHVGNFGTQFNRGTLMAAGPLGDNGTIRGTVLLAVHKPEEVADCFKTDPFVQNDILAVEAHPWLVDVLKFGTPKVPFQLARHTLCIVKKGSNWKDTEQSPKKIFLQTLLPALKSQTQDSRDYGTIP